VEARMDPARSPRPTKPATLDSGASEADMRIVVGQRVGCALPRAVHGRLDHACPDHLACRMLLLLLPLPRSRSALRSSEAASSRISSRAPVAVMQRTLLRGRADREQSVPPRRNRIILRAAPAVL
jgi:hypothetical protein